MKNINGRLNEYLTKIAELSHYQEIVALQKAISGLQGAINTAAQAKSADRMVNTMVSALTSKINTLVNMVYNYGITAPVSAKYRNEIAAKVKQLNTYVSHSNSNPYDNSVYTLVANALGPVDSSIAAYNPVNVNPQTRTGVTTVEHVGRGPTQPQIPEQAKYEFPRSQTEEESWTYNPRPGVTTDEYPPMREGVTTVEHIEPREGVTTVEHVGREPGQAMEQPEKKFDLHPKPGASGYVPGSEKDTFNVEPIGAVKGSSIKFKSKISTGERDVDRAIQDLPYAVGRLDKEIDRDNWRSALQTSEQIYHHLKYIVKIKEEEGEFDPDPSDELYSEKEEDHRHSPDDSFVTASDRINELKKFAKKKVKLAAFADSLAKKVNSSIKKAGSRHSGYSGYADPNPAFNSYRNGTLTNTPPDNGNPDKKHDYDKTCLHCREGGDEKWLWKVYDVKNDKLIEEFIDTYPRGRRAMVDIAQEFNLHINGGSSGGKVHYNLLSSNFKGVEPMHIRVTGDKIDAKETGASNRITLLNKLAAFADPDDGEYNDIERNVNGHLSRIKKFMQHRDIVGIAKAIEEANAMLDLLSDVHFEWSGERDFENTLYPLREEPLMHEASSSDRIVKLNKFAQDTQYNWSVYDGKSQAPIKEFVATLEKGDAIVKQMANEQHLRISGGVDKSGANYLLTSDTDRTVDISIYASPIQQASDRITKLLKFAAHDSEYYVTKWVITDQAEKSYDEFDNEEKAIDEAVKMAASHGIPYWVEKVIYNQDGDVISKTFLNDGHAISYGSPSSRHKPIVSLDAWAGHLSHKEYDPTCPHCKKELEQYADKVKGDAPVMPAYWTKEEALNKCKYFSKYVPQEKFVPEEFIGGWLIQVNDNLFNDKKGVGWTVDQIEAAEKYRAS